MSGACRGMKRSRTIYTAAAARALPLPFALICPTPPPRPLHPLRCFSASARAEKTAAYQRRSYQDRVRVQVTGGNGGDGCSSFARTWKGIGAPNGGSGGSGGDVILQCADDGSSRGLSLSSYHIKGGHGSNGTSDSRSGRKGDDAVLTVPAGTIVSRITHRDPDTLALHTQHVLDMHTPGQRCTLAEGGEGGYGNRALVTGYRTNNRFSSSGQPGSSSWLLLQLRTIADVGLVGMPNAGKSSLLAALTNAEPKVAAYPFTTLRPQVGVVEVQAAAGVPVGGAAMETFTMADLPGLIEDAHLDAGLGHAFLQHLHRTAVLLFVLDCSPLPAEERNPSTDFVALRRELRLYDARLLAKPWLVFANQMDRRPAAARKQYKRLREVVESELHMDGQHAVAVDDVLLGGSCLKREGLEQLVHRVWLAKVRKGEQDERERVEAEERIAAQRVVDEQRARERQQEEEGRQRKYHEFKNNRRKGKRMTAMQKDGEEEG